MRRSGCGECPSACRTCDAPRCATGDRPTANRPRRAAAAETARSEGEACWSWLDTLTKDSPLFRGQLALIVICELSTRPTVGPVGCSGVARWERARVQGFQKGHHFLTQGLSAPSPHNDGPACTARLAHPIATQLGCSPPKPF